MQLGHRLRGIQDGGCRWRGDGERNPAAAGLGGREAWDPRTPPSRRESKTKPDPPPEHRSYGQRMLDVHSLPMLTFFGLDCRKNLQRESRFCLRLSTHSCGIVRGSQASLLYPSVCDTPLADYFTPNFIYTKLSYSGLPTDFHPPVGNLVKNIDKNIDYFIKTVIIILKNDVTLPARI